MNSAAASNTSFTTVLLEQPAIRGFVSVVIPVFQDARGLKDTLSSLSRQTLSPSKFEVIVSNDGGSADVSEICKEFSVRELILSPNRGSYVARNRAIAQGRGEYFAFVDADIIVPSHWLHTGRAALQTADYVGGPVLVDGRSATTPARYHNVRTGFRSIAADNKHGFFGAGNLFVARRVLEDLGAFDERLRSSGDKEFGTRVFCSGKYIQRFLDELAVLHPPRDYAELVAKRVRVARGAKLLHELYPDRHPYSPPPLARQLRKLLLPPRPATVRRAFRENPYFSFWDFYLFHWRFAVETSLRLFLVYYRRSTTGFSSSSHAPARLARS